MTTDQAGPRMSDAVDEKLYGLVDLAEQQQAAAHSILDQLAQERVALTEEREHWIDAMQTLRAEMNATVLDAVSRNMATVVDVASEQISGVGQPFAVQMAQAADSAERAEQAFRNVIVWASARLLLWGVGALASLVLLGWLASGIVLWWDTKAIATAHVTKQQLQAEVADLRANGDAWIRAGMTSAIKRCGPKQRPCVAVDEAAGAFGDQSDYRVVKN